MSEISKDKYLEAEGHFCELQNALYELMSHAYGEDIANLLFANMNSCDEDEEDCSICEAQKEAVKEQAMRDLAYLKKAMEMLEKLVC